jgi:hypothetical protein
MRFYKFIIFLLIAFLPVLSKAQEETAKPTKAQLSWHDMEFYLFMHFGPNTFTDLEWGHGNEKEEIFNPTNLDCEQWCRIAKAAGAKGIIITAKHHDGFCLWPSKYSTHTVRESKWKDGRGDVLKDLSVACKKYNLKFGVYISPWDRNHPDYGTEKYNDVFVNMMKELFANYGPIWELWWDGANGEGPNGKKQVYDWHRFEKTVRVLSSKGYASFLHGNVVDMLYFPVVKGHFPSWFPLWGGDDFEFFRPIFNIADASITTGVLSILVFQKRFFKLQKQTETHPTVETDAVVNDESQVS